MFYKPKSAEVLYDTVIAHRGIQLEYPENTLSSYKQSVKKDFGIEMDVRMLKDETIVCFHDRFTKRLLGIPGRLSKQKYRDIKKYKVKSSDEKVPILARALSCIKGRVVILIEIKGNFNFKFQGNLKQILDSYNGEVYFHTKNLLTYFKIKQIWPNRVFWILNIFRKRFNFLKGKSYIGLPILPKLDDILVDAEDTAQTIIKKIWKYCNGYKTRVSENHWLLKYNGNKYQTVHRAIVDAKLQEHSIKAFKACIEKQKVIELDVIYYKGEIVVYHSDEISDKLGQCKSCAEKVNISNVPKLKEVLSLVKGQVPIIVDIKDFKIFNRVLEKELVKELENYKGEIAVQAFNPLAIMYFEKNHPEIIRGQVGHSLKGLKDFGRIILPIVNFMLFYYGNPDYIVYDLDPNVHALSKFNNVLGLPVLGYAPKSKQEILEYVDYFDNFIVEGDW